MTVSDDLRYAFRRLRGRPLFVLVAVSTLALGIGFNAVIFSLLNSFLLRPLPIADPGRVFSLAFGKGGHPSVSYPDYTDIRDRSRVFSQVAAMRAMPAALSLRGKSSLAWGYLVSGNYFDLLGIQAWRGRLLAPADDLKTGAHPYIVLSYGCFQRRFGADPQIIGRSIKLDGHPFTVIGVTPPGFIGTERIYAAEYWVTLSMIREIEGRDWRPARTTRNLWAIARLKPGTSVPQAAAFLKILADQMAREHPNVNEGFAIRLAPVGLIGNLLRGPFIGFGLGLLLVCGLTLLVACTNLSGLLLAHAADRRKEFAIRLAMGADRRAISRLLLTESLLISLAGGAAGLLTTVWLRNGIQALMPATDFALNTSISIDWRVVVFAFGVSVLTAFLFGLLPALSSARVDLAPALKDAPGAGALRGLHLRDFYVAVQVALSLVLLAGSVMMVRTLSSALRVRYGFDPDGAVAVTTYLQMAGYNEERGLAFQHRLLERVRDLPGIEAAALANSIPFSLDVSTSGISIEGSQASSMSRLPSSVVYECSPGYFHTMGTRLLSGREFNEGDRAGAPRVAIVNETFVRKLLPDGNPIGKRFRFGLGGEYTQIVGVVEAGKYETITEDPKIALWRPQAQAYNGGDTTVVARVRGRESDALTAIRQVIQAMDPDLAVSEAHSLRQYMDLPLSPLRVATSSLVAMGGLVLLLSALGLYGLLANSTARRTREIAIRMALGARPADVLTAVLKRVAILCGASGAVGLALSFASTRLLGSLLYGEADSAVYLPAVALLAAVAVAACLLPARRALRVDPASALRYD